MKWLKRIEETFKRLKEKHEMSVVAAQTEAERELQKTGLTKEQAKIRNETIYDLVTNQATAPYELLKMGFKVVTGMSSKQEAFEEITHTSIGRILGAHSLAPRGLQEGYPNPSNVVKNIMANKLLGGELQETKRTEIDQIYSAAKSDPDVLHNYENSIRLMDYYNLYVGMPQNFNTLGISEWRPQGADCDYPVSHVFYKDNNISATLQNNLPTILQHCKESLNNNSLETTNGEEQSINTCATYIMADALYSAKYNGAKGEDLYNQLNEQELNSVGDQLGHYFFKVGHDDKGYYLSYYDHWDMSISEAMGKAKNSKDTDWGKPMDIYDRIYFNPNTLEPIRVQTPRENVRERILADANSYNRIMKELQAFVITGYEPKHQNNTWRDTKSYTNTKRQQSR